MFQHYLKMTLRHFRRNRVFASISVLGFAVGIAMAMMIYVFVKHEYRYDQFVKNKDRIYRMERWNLGSMPSLVGYALMGHTPEIELATRIYHPGVDVVFKKDENKLTIRNCVFADSTFFKMFPFEFIAGSPDGSLTRPLTMVLTKSEARRLFGDENPIGKSMLLENQYPFTVTGVIKDIEYFHMPIRAVGSLITFGQDFLKRYDSWEFPTYVLLPPQHDRALFTETINKRLQSFGYEHDPFRLRSLNDIYFTKGIEGERVTIHGDKDAVFIFITIAVLVLLISGINYVNLSTAKATLRAKEVGVKKMVGALRNQLVFQFLFESILIALVALPLAFLLAELALPVFAGFLESDLSIGIFYSPPYLAALVLLTIILGFISGLYPAFYLNSLRPVAMLRRQPLEPGFNILTRRGLIVFQFVISSVLIASAAGISRQLSFAQNKNLGFNKDQVVILRNNMAFAQKAQVFKEELKKHPGIRAVSFSYAKPGTEWPGWCCVKIDHTAENHQFEVNSVDPDYIETLGLDLIKGRNFSREQPTDHRGTYIITESAMRQFNITDPIGKHFSNTGNGSEGIVIGVVKDFHHRSLHKVIEPAMFTWDESGYGFQLINIKIAPQDINASIAAIEKVWKRIASDFPFEFEFLDQSLQALYRREQRVQQVVGYFSVVAIFISCMGAFGLAAFSAERRTKEIGIRKAVGASMTDIFMMLTKDFTLLVLLASIIAWPIAWYAMNRWLQTFAYRIELGWGVFVLAGLSALLIALLTVSAQTIKAALANPVEALRYE